MESDSSDEDPLDSREDYLLLAEFAYDSNRFEHMLFFMKKVIEIASTSGVLSQRERQTFSSACSFLNEYQRRSLRFVTRVGADSIATNPARARAACEFIDLIKSEIAKTCSDIVGTVDLLLFPRKQRAVAATAESRIFYSKMKGDYLRYKADVLSGSEREETAEASLKVYMDAKVDAAVLPVTNPARLELYMSLALFYVDLRDSYDTACAVAKEAIDPAKEALRTPGVVPTAATTVALKRLQTGVEVWDDLLKSKKD